MHTNLHIAQMQADCKTEIYSYLYSGGHFPSGDAYALYNE